MKRLKRLAFIIAFSAFVCGCTANGVIRDKVDTKVEGETIEKMGVTVSGTDELNYAQEDVIEYLNQQYPSTTEYEVINYYEVDLDLDGYDEVVISFGYSDNDIYEQYIQNIFVLSMIDGFDVITIIEDSYTIYDVQIIELGNADRKFLYYGVTNTGNLYGFAICTIFDGELNYICNSASASGSGEDKLEDYNNDGIYDGYTMHRWSDDFLFYETYRSFIWLSDGFYTVDSNVNVSEYPNNVEDVVIQYLSLKSLNDEVSREIQLRLANLYSGEDNIDTNVVSHNDLLSFIYGMDDFINLSTEEREDGMYVVNLSNGSKSTNEYSIGFVLEEQSDKWRIIEIMEE